MAIEVGFLDRALFASLWLSICAVIYFWLVRQLPRPWRRLASAALLVHVLLALAAEFHQPASQREQWFWDLGAEWNISSMAASTQLALVGLVAFIASWHVRRRQKWHCLYLVGLGAGYIWLALVEYYGWKGSVVGTWHLPYVLLGGPFAALTAVQVETFRSGKRLWLIYVIPAMALMAMSGMMLDFTKGFCDVFFGLRFEGCIDRYILEESLEVIAGWIALVALLGHFSEVAPSPSRRVRWSLFLLPPVLILLFSQTANLKPISEQTGARSANVVFEAGEKLHAYRLSSRDREVSVQLFLSVPESDFHRLGYSIRLIDPLSERSVASVDRHLSDHWQFYLGPGYAPVYTQWTELDIPADLPDNHAYLAVLTFWRDAGAKFVLQKVRSSDRRLLSESQVVLREIVFRQRSAEPPGAVYARFANGFTLDPVDMPARAQAGDALSIPFTWRAAAADPEDYVQFLHFLHEETGGWWVWDSQPLGARLPTRLWYEGLVETETWKVPLRESLAPGRYAVFTGLYRVVDLERLPASHADGAPFVDARLPLGTLTVEPAEQ